MGAAQAPVRDAIVVVVNQTNQSSIGLKTDGSGRFTAPVLKPGKYSVGVRKEGFQPTVQANIVVEPSRAAKVNLQLVPDAGEPASPVKASDPRQQGRRTTHRPNS